jgi:hypothetical protein
MEKIFRFGKNKYKIIFFITDFQQKKSFLNYYEGEQSLLFFFFPCSGPHRSQATMGGNMTRMTTTNQIKSTERNRKKESRGVRKVLFL